MLLGQPTELDYDVVDGQWVFGGDMVLAPEDRLDDGTGALAQPLYRSGTTPTSALWPNGVIPYTIASSVTTPALVNDAMAEWNAKTTIRFVPRTNQTSYVTFTELAGNTICKAQVGYATGQRFIYLRDTSISTPCNLGVVVHELGHTIGFLHEQSRPDRDTYVKINAACIPIGLEPAFAIISSGATKIGPYDIVSTMQYRSTTITPASGCGGYAIYKKDGGLLLHNWADLSAGDIAGAKQVYGVFFADAGVKDGGVDAGQKPDAGQTADAGQTPDAGVEHETVPDPVIDEPIADDDQPPGAESPPEDVSQPIHSGCSATPGAPALALAAIAWLLHRRSRIAQRPHRRKDEIRPARRRSHDS
jgi:uncharacterized protein (TIGR03382 family)